MPNWCENYARISHPDTKKIDRIAEEAHQNGRFFDLVVPEPEHAPDTEKNTTLGNWYTWRLENWGSKWEADISVIMRNPDESVSLYFNSAWSPPLPVYDALAREGYTVEAEYLELGMAFAGTYKNSEERAGNFNSLAQLRTDWPTVWERFDMDSRDDDEPNEPQNETE